MGCATTLPPIQKNSSASLEMEAFCHSLGDVMMEWVGEARVLPAGGRFPGEDDLLLRVGERLTGDREPRDRKEALAGVGGMQLSPGGEDATLAGAMRFMAARRSGSATSRPPGSCCPGSLDIKPTFCGNQGNGD